MSLMVTSLLMTAHDSIRRPFQRAALSVALDKEIIQRMAAAGKECCGTGRPYVVLNFSGRRRMRVYAIHVKNPGPSAEFEIFGLHKRWGWEKFSQQLGPLDLRKLPPNGKSRDTLFVAVDSENRISSYKKSYRGFGWPGRLAADVADALGIHAHPFLHPHVRIANLL